MSSLLNFIVGSGSSKKAQVAKKKFDSDEKHLLKKTWQDLADRSNGKGIDKETFLQYFPLHGLMGERLFMKFNTANNGSICYDEFIMGLATVCRGSMDDKIHFVFDLYHEDADDKTVSKLELSTLLNQVPKEICDKYYQREERGGELDDINYEQHDDLDIAQTQSGQQSPTFNAHRSDDFSDDHEDVDKFTNHDMVEKVFEECDLNHEGRLTYEEFKMWVQRTPMIMDYIESILPYNGPKDVQPHHDKRETLPHMRRITSKAVSNRGESINDVAGDIFNHSTSVRPHSTKVSLKRSTSTMSQGGSGLQTPGSFTYEPSQSGKDTCLHLSPRSLSGESGSQSNRQPPSHASALSITPPMLRRDSSCPELHRRDSVVGEDSDEMVREYLYLALEAAQSEGLRSGIQEIISKLEVESRGANEAEVYRTVVCLEDYLWKKGKSLFHLLSKRYYLLSGNCLYYYTHKRDIRSRGVIFLTGSIIERVKDEDMEIKGYFGFEMLHQDLCTGEHHRHDKRVMYCRSLEAREKWVTTLQHAAHVVPIEDEYVIGKELGNGRFSIVCECVHKDTGSHYAVKIIDKTTIEPEEKALLRTEIAVLKLVDHPNIIRMEGLYESKTHMYIVMEKLNGGELFERIVGRPRFTEEETARLLRPLLESVAYLHDLGIVHRDLKPENILVGDDLDSVKIADFGLSKMVLPKEKMDSACGTLSYVAPEVLTMQGYGKEADLWSVGVIMFLLLCGKLPFDGADQNEIIVSTIQADLKINQSVWDKLSTDAKGLIKALLHKEPSERITARDTLKHPFFSSYLQLRRQHLHQNSVILNNHLRSSNSSVSSGSATPTSCGTGTDKDKGANSITSTSTTTTSATSSSGVAPARPLPANPNNQAICQTINPNLPNQPISESAN